MTDFIRDVTPENIGAPIKAIKDKAKLVPAFLKTKGLVKQHIGSFDHFINVEIKKIIKANQKIVSDVDPAFQIKYLSINLGELAVDESYQEQKLITPHMVVLKHFKFILLELFSYDDRLNIILAQLV
ncbi:DNA-directed RNA polymerase III subunit RPC2 [Araneus ventricosus]|uniref:DNA-directed RNA polymerase n=1 Tax=Araneus ventricosus TaxID=182803 RepID=A0A4Y2HPW6_ARAVE|nr:DNA-directed RNA polymerase III subunit RPC2 [Araneus ventricosus]